ncbi:hypothetical protein FRC17_009509 [Serendipita sp. 399]|nr:hypothetical protein FRC17_009509 [Serendipita sp. 399]
MSSSNISTSSNSRSHGLVILDTASTSTSTNKSLGKKMIDRETSLNPSTSSSSTTREEFPDLFKVLSPSHLAGPRRSSQGRSQRRGRRINDDGSTPGILPRIERNYFNNEGLIQELSRSPTREPAKNRKRGFDDGCDYAEAIFEPKADKRVKLNASGMASSSAPRMHHLNSNTSGKEFSSVGLRSPINLESVFYPVVDDPSIGHISNDEIEQVISILPDSMNRVDCISPDSVADELTEEDYFLFACGAFSAYITLVKDAKSSPKLLQEARDQMAGSWSLWHAFSMAPIGMNELRLYGGELDAEGRQALATALGIEHSYQLQSWIDEVRPSFFVTPSMLASSPLPSSAPADESSS